MVGRSGYLAVAVGGLVAAGLIGWLALRPAGRRAPDPALTMPSEAGQPAPSSASGPGPAPTGGPHARLPLRLPTAAPLQAGADAAADPGDRTPGKQTPTGEITPKNSQIALLESLLDENDNDAVLAQALKMTRSPDAAVRAAALEALRWVGGNEAAEALADLVNDADAEVSREATSGLVSVLDELDDPKLAAGLLEQAARKSPQGGDAEALFLKLSGLPEETSVPALLNLLEAEASHVSALAKEYLEFVTGGEEISTRAQGEAWLKEHARDDSSSEEEN